MKIRIWPFPQGKNTSENPERFRLLEEVRARAGEMAQKLQASEYEQQVVRGVVYWKLWGLDSDTYHPGFYLSDRGIVKLMHPDGREPREMSMKALDEILQCFDAMEKELPSAS